MKKAALIIFLQFFAVTLLFAQGDDFALARQFAANGEQQKALELYQKLYKQDNDTYYPYYITTLLALKKFDDAENVTKKMERKHPGDYRYSVTLGRIYTQKGDIDKANEIYDELIKNLPADPGVINSLASQFYQAENTDYAIKIFLQGRKLLNNDKLYAFELINLYRFKRDKAGLVGEYLNFLPDNPTFAAQAENTLSTTFEGPPDYDMLKAALYQRIQKDPQQTIYVDMLVWDFLQQKDYDQALNQALALNRRQNDDGNGIYELCQTLVSDGAYDAAIRGYEYIISKGKDHPLYISAKIDLINTKNLLVTSGKYTDADLLSLEKDYNDLLSEFGKTAGTVFAMQRLAKLEAFKLHKYDEAQKLLEEAVAVPDIKAGLLASCKLDLGDVYMLNGRRWEATLLYEQVETNHPGSAVSQEAKFRDAKLAYYFGDFTWAKGQLDVLKAATSELIANDALNLSIMITENLAADTSGAALKMFARADMQIYAEQPEKAVAILDSIGVKYPGNNLSDDILMAKARILIQQKNYADAIIPLKKIAEEHPFNLWADDAVFMLGDLYENRLNDKEKAKAYYQKIITDYPGSLYINEARKRFRLLRGDKPTGES
ncbi:MAG TPA: tetratricopeptide repeat protein [Mucilaginibacter sp.]|jgi:tetratricopeptide (TPR) repeat protein|nr:tetratricopeptide repeat protein [Mucilaginibacter sp.]